MASQAGHFPRVFGLLFVEMSYMTITRNNNRGLATNHLQKEMPIWFIPAFLVC